MRLSLLKPPHTEWLVDFYDHMTSGTAKKIIDSPPFHNHAICDLSPELKSIGYSREDVSDEEEEVWGPADDRNIFDVIDEFDHENEDL